jgi:fructose 5-dehydrogenase cytochrome subunit
MPGFGGKPEDVAALSDQDIALLGNYVLRQYGNSHASITVQKVAEVRNGGPSSSLVTLARADIGATAVGILLLLAYVTVRSRKRRV